MSQAAENQNTYHRLEIERRVLYDALYQLVVICNAAGWKRTAGDALEKANQALRFKAPE